MEERQDSARTAAETCKQASSATSKQTSGQALGGKIEKATRLAGFTPFLVGIVVALILGWWVYPSAMLTAKAQPVVFNHRVHIEEASLDCVECHALRADGTFSGFPTTKDCAVCHAQVLGKSKAERDYVEDYVRTGKEVDWLVYQKQPDNVFFSHAPHALQNCNQCHTFSQTELCAKCHIDVWNSTKPPVVKENKLTTYTVNTMKMWQCEQCHANPNHLAGTAANNACFVCHK